MLEETLQLPATRVVRERASERHLDSVAGGAADKYGTSARTSGWPSDAAPVAYFVPLPRLRPEGVGPASCVFCPVRSLSSFLPTIGVCLYSFIALRRPLDALA